jgi:hypothetical protein
MILFGSLLVHKDIARENAIDRTKYPKKTKLETQPSKQFIATDLVMPGNVGEYSR